MPSLALALAAMHAALEPLAAAQAAADAASDWLASVESAAAADVPPPLREQRHAILTVRAVLAAAAASLDGAQQAANPVADALAAEVAAAAVRQVVPALTAHLQAALAATPRHQTPHQPYSHAARNQHQQQQRRQPSGGSLHGSWGSGSQHLDVSSSAPLRFGDFDSGVLGGGGQHVSELPGAFIARLYEETKWFSMSAAALCIRCCSHPLVPKAASPAADM